MRSVVSRCRWCSPDVEVGEYHSEDTALAAAAAAPSSLQHRVVGNDLYNYITLPYTYSPVCAPRHRDETTSSTDTPPLLRFSAPRRSRYTANPPPLPPLARTDRSHNFAPPPPVTGIHTFDKPPLSHAASVTSSQSRYFQRQHRSVRTVHRTAHTIRSTQRRLARRHGGVFRTRQRPAAGQAAAAADLPR